MLDSSDSRNGFPAGEFTKALREGMKTEPEKFPDLVESFRTRVKRANPKFSEKLVQQRTLDNISAYACMADHDFGTVMVLRGVSGGPKNVYEWYDNPDEYGTSMTAFADYMGVKGVVPLRELVLD